MIYPQKISVAKERINNRTIGDHEIQDIKINMRSLFTKDDLENFKTGFMSGVKEKLLIFGNYTSIILGIIIIIQCLRYLVSTVINFRFLRKTLGSGIHTLGAFSTAIAHYLVLANSEPEGSSEEMQNSPPENKSKMYPTIVQIENHEAKENEHQAGPKQNP